MDHEPEGYLDWDEDTGQEMEAAKSGKLGKRYQQFLEEHPDGSLNAEVVFLQCTECGVLKCGPDLSMYIRNPDYVSPMELERENTYTLYAPGHICRKCGKPMRSITDNELSQVKYGSGADGGQTDVSCPKCREPLWIDGVLFWD